MVLFGNSVRQIVGAEIMNNQAKLYHNWPSLCIFTGIFIQYVPDTSSHVLIKNLRV